MPVYNQTDKSKWTKDKRHWYFRCYYTDIHGKRRLYNSKMYLTQDAAKEAESAFLIKIKQHDNNEDILFKNLIDEYLYYKKRVLKSTTYYGNKTYINKHILPLFDNKKLSQINRPIINQWLEYIESQKYSIRYKNKIIRIFKEILNYAKDNYKLDQKIITTLQLIKDEAPITEEKITNFWNYGEWRQFIKNVDDDYYYTIFNFLYFTGCRIGEVMALNWHDIDFNKKTVSITKSLTAKVGNNSYIITSPKTNNSVRKIDIPDDLLELLKKHYENEKKIYSFNKSMFVFGNLKHLSATTLRTHLYKYIEKAKVKKITKHGFRHSHVSLLIYLGCNFRDVAERIGDTITMVQNTYYHMYPAEKSEVITRLNDL